RSASRARAPPSPRRGESAIVQARRCAMGCRDRRTAWRVGLALALLLALAGLAQAQDAKKAPPSPKLPEPLTHDAIRELVARLSDVEVRQLLIAQLDRAAVPAAPDRPPPSDGDVMGMVGGMEGHSQQLRAEA